MPVKNDQGKARTDLLPAHALLLVAEALRFGDAKYPGQLPDAVGPERLLAATLRHLLAYMTGERLDVESELPHLAHAATDLLYLLECAHPSLAEKALPEKPAPKPVDDGHTYDFEDLWREVQRENKELRAELRTFYATATCVEDCVQERSRQIELWGEQTHPSGIHATGFTGQLEMKAKESFAIAQESKSLTWKHILDEEVAELYNCHDPESAYTEAIQVAAVALSMAESIQKNGLFGRVKE